MGQISLAHTMWLVVGVQNQYRPILVHAPVLRGNGYLADREWRSGNAALDSGNFRGFSVLSSRFGSRSRSQNVLTLVLEN